jgi:hypothetical protein
MLQVFWYLFCNGKGNFSKVPQINTGMSRASDKKNALVNSIFSEKRQRNFGIEMSKKTGYCFRV